MLVNLSDNTIKLCEGGLWIELSEVAKITGKTTSEVVESSIEKLTEHNDYVIDSIVDYATQLVADVITGAAD